MMSAGGRCALVTGGTRGIGLAIAESLSRLGYRAVVNYRHDEARARDAVARLRTIDPGAWSVRADVTVEEEVRRLFAEVVSAEGRIDVLVCGVGDVLFRPVAETTLVEWDSILRSNLTSAFLCSREVLPVMRTQSTGAIVFVASMHSEVLRAVPNTVPYAIAKTGLVVLAKSLAKTEAASGIRVNVVCPGFVESGKHSPAHTSSRVPFGRLARGSEIAEAVSFLASDKASYVTGAVLNVHGGAFL
jgi:3-oxoacyl-[acyl-carrier protein] reductase